MEYVLALVLLAVLVAAAIALPLVRSTDDEQQEAERTADLEVAKESKYAEIRDAELDFQMGKVSEADHRETDRELRAQAIDILRELDRLKGEEPRGAR
jgi:uncharacterized tellurite resistance protein B-like protein